LEDSDCLNSFDAIGRIELEDGVEEEFKLRSPTTFLDVFEKALSSRDKGKAKVGEHVMSSSPGRGFSPTTML
jgi:hypothetical protein